MERDIFWPPAKDLAQRFGVDITTARRWRRGHHAPRAVVLLVSGDLGVFDPIWEGWCVRDGILRSPEGFEATMSDVRSLPFVRLQVVTHRSENVKLRAENQELRQYAVPVIEEQPTPEQWADDINFG